MNLPEPIAYATIIDEGRIIFLPRPSLNAQAMAAIYSADQMRAYATAAVLAEREKNARIADDARATRVESAAQNNGRASDFAFGYVNAAEEIASAIRGSSPASQGEGE